MQRDAALAELSRALFRQPRSRTAQDFAAWSGLTLQTRARGIEALDGEFIARKSARHTFVFRPASLGPRGKGCFAFLLPDYDEYVMGYRDRSALIWKKMPLAHNRMIVADGQIVGSWRRPQLRNATGIELDCPLPLGRSKRRAVAAGGSPIRCVFVLHDAASDLPESLKPVRR